MVLAVSTWASALSAADCALACWLHAELAPAAPAVRDPASAPAAFSAASSSRCFFSSAFLAFSAASESESSSESPEVAAPLEPSPLRIAEVSMPPDEPDDEPDDEPPEARHAFSASSRASRASSRASSATSSGFLARSTACLSGSTT